MSAATKPEALLATRALDVHIAGRDVVRGLDFRLCGGETTALLGRNGVGKTTLMHVLAGLRRADGGQVRLAGQDLAGMNRRAVAQRLGLLMQNIEDPFPTTVLETALIGRHPHLGFWQWEDRDDVELARRALTEMALEGLEERDVHHLSGGERRRLAMATILTQDPDVFLLDEPLDQLDPHHQLALMERLDRRVSATGRAALISLHDVNMAARFAHRALLLFGDGDSVQGPTEEVLTVENVERLYRTPMLRMHGAEHPVFVPR